MIRFIPASMALLYVVFLLVVGIFIDTFIGYSFIILSLGVSHAVYRFGRFTLLELVVVATLYAPFSIVFLYIGFGELIDFGSGANALRYLAMFDSITVSRMLFVGMLTVGCYFFSVIFVPPVRRDISFRLAYNASGLMQIMLLIVGLLLVTFSSRSSNIFVHTYGAESHMPTFAGGIVAGYVIWIYVYLREKVYIPRKLVLNIFWMIVVYHLIFQQILVGSREFVGLMIGIFSVATVFNKSRRKVLVPIFFLGSVFFVMLALGAFRGAVVHGLESISILNVFNNNPWNSILLSVLGFSDQTLRGESVGSPFYWIELFYSLVPGFIYRLLDLPVFGISYANEPGAWFADYTGGGAYVGIRFFETLGFFIGATCLFLLFCVINSVDRVRGKGFFYYFMYLIVLISIFRWFWYGDMEFLRALQVGFFIVGFILLVKRGSRNVGA